VSALRLCLRCDWTGETDATVCPSCGTVLFRPPRSAAKAVPRADPVVEQSPRPRVDPFPPAADDRPSIEPTSRPRVTAAVVAAVVLTIAAFAWVRGHTPPPAPPATGLPGRLVYAVADRDGWSRLWTWDLEANAAIEGPRVREPVELVNAYGAGDGWIGVTSRLPDGRFSGGVLRYLDPTDQVTPLLTADLMAWGPRGEGLAGVRRAPGRGCPRLQVLYAGLVAPTGTEVRVDRSFCGDVVTIGRDDLRTYLTLRRGPHARIVFAGLDRFHAVLGGYALASASPAADLLVVPVNDRGTAPTWPADTQPHGRPGGAKGTGMYFRGLSRGTPILYGDPPYVFNLDGVLGWSSDASVALVTGRLADRWGIFELDAGPSAGHHAPRFLGFISGEMFATYTDDGTGIVDNAGMLSALRGGRLIPLTLPPGAPTPNGPIVWIR
jgi:hypothetical protein